MNRFDWFARVVRRLRRLRVIASLGIGLALLLAFAGPLQVQAQTCMPVVTDYASFTACSGSLTDGHSYGFEVPENWNGTLVLISIGYGLPGSPDPPVLNFFETRWGHWLLQHGYALATSYSGGGYVVHESLHNQIETLDLFASRYGTPMQTIATGSSLGGIITAGLVQQHPDRFAGALPMAGPLAGSVATWNQGLDFAFVFKQLLAPGSALRVVGITNPGTPTSGNWGLAEQILIGAQGTPEGRARIALASAVSDIPGWYYSYRAEPPAYRYDLRENNQFLWARDVVAGFMFGFGRADLEGRAGGNPSWNTDVNYEAQLEKSVNYDEVVALYAAAGLSLDDDLGRLKAAARISADPAAVQYLEQNIVFDGDLRGVPVLAMHTTGDGLVVVQHEFAYRFAALEALDSQLLRQGFVHRGGHADLTEAEIIAAFEALFQRIDTGKWNEAASPDSLNAVALALGSYYNVLIGGGFVTPTAPAYFDYECAQYLRPYDSATAGPLQAVAPATAGVAQKHTLQSARPLTAWPLPYRGGSLQVSFAPGTGADTRADVAIYDLSGRRVCPLAGAGSSGTRSYAWDGRDAHGVPVRNGIYFLRASDALRSAQLKIVVLR